jgi:hypothetical protein
MFQRGDKIHTHDGKTHVVRRRGQAPKMGKIERPKIRGFVRGALVDCLTGEELAGDWHENIITTYGHGQVIRQYVAMGGASAASFWGIGYMTEAQSSNFSTRSDIDSTEYGLHSSGGVSRATVSVGSQTLSGTWTLSQSFQYASTHISHAQTVNCIAQYGNSSVGAGTAHSLATFASSTKGTTQALNVSYNWIFSTVFAFAFFGNLIYLSLLLNGFLDGAASALL